MLAAAAGDTVARLTRDCAKFISNKSKQIKMADENINSNSDQDKTVESSSKKVKQGILQYQSDKLKWRRFHSSWLNSVRFHDQ